MGRQQSLGARGARDGTQRFLNASEGVDSSRTETTILVVEDEDDVRDLVTMALRFRGFTVVEAESGAEALGLARTANPGLIVHDAQNYVPALPAPPTQDDVDWIGKDFVSDSGQ